MSGSMACNIPESVTSSSNLMTVRFTTSSGLRRRESPAYGYTVASTTMQKVLVDSTTDRWESGTSATPDGWDYGFSSSGMGYQHDKYGLYTSPYESTNTPGPITYETRSGTGFLALFSTVPCDSVS